MKTFYLLLSALCICIYTNTAGQNNNFNKEPALLKYPKKIKDYKDKTLSFDSIYNNKEYNIKTGYYNKGDEKVSHFHELINNAPDGSVVEIPQGEYKSKYFFLTNRHNLTIKAKPGTVWLVSDDETNTIFIVQNCSNIIFQGIGFLHRTEAFCSENSIEIHRSENIVFDHCDISGSGTIGIVASLVDALSLKNSFVHHCTYQMMQIDNCRNLIILNNLFKNNKETQTYREGITIGNIWGKCIIQNNSFIIPKT